MVVVRREVRRFPKAPPTHLTVTARNARGGTRRANQGSVGFNQGSMAARTEPVGSGAIWLQAPTPGDQ
jgi:hypothetical protein